MKDPEQWSDTEKCFASASLVVIIVASVVAGSATIAVALKQGFFAAMAACVGGTLLGIGAGIPIAAFYVGVFVAPALKKEAVKKKTISSTVEASA